MRTRLLALLFLALPGGIAAQPGSSNPTPPPGRAYLFTLDLQGTPLEEFPGSVKALNGVMSVVDRNGQHMLKASSPSEFLITLPQVLPAEFTIELDFIPKACCAPDDIMLEGTPTMNRGVASVQLTWQPERISAVGGGGEMYQSAMPADLAASTPGNLTHVVVAFQGTTIKLYTNGRRLYTLEKQFARGRVLRVWLGGADDGLNALYLAGLRIGSGPADPKVIAGNEGASGKTGNPGSQPKQPETSNTSAAGFAAFSVTAGSDAGATLTWQTTMKGQDLGGFQIERREVGGAFSPVVKAFTILSDFDFTLRDDFSAQAGTRYEYQIKEIDRSGAVIATSTLQGFEVAAHSEQRQVASNQQASTGSMLPTVVTNVTVAQASAGPVVNWLPVTVPAVYSVARWKLDDPACCRNASPPMPALNGPPWQDAPLPVAGTYVYEVRATMNGGVATGQSQFVNLVSGGKQIAAVAPGSAPVTAVPATATGTITPMTQSTAPVLPAPSSLPTLAPPPPPPIAAPTGPAPRPAGTSTIVFGPTSLTATPIGWGVELRWPEVVGAKEYQVESGATGQTFAFFATVQLPVQPGTYSRTDQSMEPGSTTFYRVAAILSDGTRTPYSQVARHDAPAQVPYVSGLNSKAVPPPPGPVLVGAKYIRWYWAEITGVADATSYAIQTDVFSKDATGALIPVSGGSKRSASSNNWYDGEFPVGSGKTVRFCISVVIQRVTDPLRYAVCQMTTIP